MIASIIIPPFYNEIKKIKNNRANHHINNIIIPPVRQSLEQNCLLLV